MCEALFETVLNQIGNEMQTDVDVYDYWSEIEKDKKGMSHLLFYVKGQAFDDEFYHTFVVKIRLSDLEIESIKDETADTSEDDEYDRWLDRQLAEKRGA